MQAAQIRKDLLAKYDLNHNGIIDLDEREAALDDPAFIESELDKIDANHDGWLEASELVYFDANLNKMLDPKEQKGIDIAEHLLAQRAMKKFDVNGNGVLEPAEFSEFIQTCMPAARQSPAGMPGMFGMPMGALRGNAVIPSTWINWKPICGSRHGPVCMRAG